ncbi:NXPE family member 1 isoform X2 [Xenopus tropicalis]|uniref:NXPE family member 1 n=1 Tax=Xenopus tropicalis TaxID=8364 RepID=F7C4B6_XENTR|nr:NXPE family member 1 isoform X2 [Xenopus tropicalis]
MSKTKVCSTLLIFVATFIISFTHYRILFKDVKYSKQPVTPSDHEQRIIDIFSSINNKIPSVSFININHTTSAKKSKAFILDHPKEYCVGDSLTIQLDMFDYIGKKKTYGGDYLRARIFSPKLGAGASGIIKDFKNGTYHVQFKLFWEGNVQISILLMHPSEGVAALWRARNSGYKNINFNGKFLNKSKEVQTECGFHLDSQEEKCEYVAAEEYFYCIKPFGVPCDAFISMNSYNRPHAYLTELEKSLFIRSNIAAEIPQKFGSIDVLSCQRNSGKVKPKCSVGMYPPFPGGYFFNNVWHPVFCNLSTYEPHSLVDKCLSDKLIYLMGDSTIRQWIEYLPSIMKGLKFFNLHGIGWHKTHLALDMNLNTYIQWKKHGHPFVTMSFFTVKHYTSVPQEIDRLAGGPYTVIVIALGQHFRPFPITLFIRRLLNVRKAIERLFVRSPDTKVIIKSENTREVNTDVERFSDFHGYIQYLLAKDIFQGLNVGIIDAWDMTVASGSFDVHPASSVIKSQINMFLEFLC